MQIEFIAAALLSAVLHAGWNAAVKAQPRPTEAMAAQMFTSALIVCPGLLFTGLPAPAAWPWVIASTILNITTVQALLKAYELAGFGTAYTFSRAIAMLFIVPLGALVAGDAIGLTALLGIGIIVASLAMLAWSARSDRSLPVAAMRWIALSGVAAAGYIICDAQGVRAAGSALAYGFATSVVNALAFAWRLRAVHSPLRVLQANWRIGLPTSVAAVLSYVLILWVWAHVPVAPASALRDTSSAFALIIATVYLKEPLTPLRIFAVVLAAIAVPLLRLG